MSTNIKIVDVAPDYWTAAASVGQGFLHDYADRAAGVHNGVVYLKSNGLSFYVYRVKTGVVVRGNGDA